ncbi:MAG: hypothetical protein IBJ12_00625 [Sphingomonadaceae bacterium]|nr:hypothetical protein [Sphingomonadaceae bacterium]
MAEPAFSPEVTKLLDAYAVPTLPEGFTDRLMARVESGDTGAVDAVTHLPLPRTRRSSPWRRTSRIVGSVAIFSLATATAAAAGIFGNPVYVPGVSEALVEAKIVEAPKPKARPKVQMVAESKAPVTTVAPAPQPATGSAAIVNRVTELRQNPDFAALTPRQRLAVTGREVRQMVRSGEVSRQDVRTAVRELAQNAEPATKEAWRQAAVERREKRIERRHERFAPLAVQPTEPQTVTEINPAGTDDVASEILPEIETARLSPERVEALRERYRNATPEQRAELRSALRDRRQARQQRRAQ